MKSRRMSWVRHVAHAGERRDVYRVLVRKLKGRDHLNDLSIDGRILLK
jgi:hypothetical protein